ncbi:hypothetical protein [Dyadobacter chenhuakuii]|uniref:Uncharacterized protein n=1 Tax=Dyadobacter chenhuakuii TaxID=2909339 RepID=A0A9X1QGL5_9BACT|nr:hypothetical protein [Dyadobacter chenhuakuii]MCF2501035.1 hypothetical protein [Dyadobacter chenhuakuii]
MFDIYIQSGEFIGEKSNIWVSLFKDFLIPALSVGIPLYIFYTGISSQRNEDEAKGRKKDAESLKYMALKVSKIIKYINLLQLRIDESLSQAEFQIRNAPIVDLPASNEITRLLEKLDHESILRAYKSIMSSDHKKITGLFDTIDEVNLIKLRLERTLSDFAQSMGPFDAEFRAVFTSILFEIQLLELSNSASASVFDELRAARDVYFINEENAIKDLIDFDFEMIFIDQIVHLTATYVGQGKSKFEKILLLARDFHPKLVGYNLRSARLQHELRKLQTAVLRAQVDMHQYSIDLTKEDDSGTFDRIASSKSPQTSSMFRLLMYKHRQ